MPGIMKSVTTASNCPSTNRAIALSPLSAAVTT
jgi:hypothetical protein